MNKTVAAISLAAFSVSLATGAMAEDLVIPLPKDTTVEKVETVYFNAGEVSLVRLGLKDGVTVAANVISASGAKYQGGIYVWWSKGDEADLYDLMADPEMKKPVHCVDVKKS